ncbi:hypothetical protein BUALT_Bualt01G0085000 [Buddleja alternifolia]|uniref:Avr9/Cf-9 rapidly elicited protein 65-like n=1 Tax=Buddleja alternifolia TaxID=168488 RepID=A0AAV6YCF9_9LAMI|nr:hypothetical protein BUALT_Bualt01G0085000 [Buddleja alternifolia]
MFMSLFSSFDVRCAEAFGQKIAGVSTARSSSNKQESSVAAAVQIDDLKKGKEVNTSSQPSDSPKKSEDRRTIRMPRFAPEFDGVHCFETILPY